MEPNTTTAAADAGILSTTVAGAGAAGAAGTGAAGAAGTAGAAAGAVVQAPGQAAAGVKAPEGALLTGTGAETPESKAAAEKAAADKVTADAAAKGAAVEVKWGELQVSPELSGKFTAAAKDLGLDSAKAQKIADVYIESQKTAEAELKTALDQQNKKWVESIKADKELGGTAFNESVNNARKFLAKYDTDGRAGKVIDALGASNNPDLVRLLARAGKAIAEDSINGTNRGGSAAAANDEAAKLQRAYPSMFNPDGTPKASGDRKATS